MACLVEIDSAMQSAGRKVGVAATMMAAHLRTMDPVEDTCWAAG